MWRASVRPETIPYSMSSIPTSTSVTRGVTNFVCSGVSVRSFVRRQPYVPYTVRRYSTGEEFTRTGTVLVRSIGNLRKVPYEYLYSNSRTVPNPAREKNYEYEYCTLLPKFGRYPVPVPVRSIFPHCRTGCVRDSFAIRSRFVRDACLPACLPACMYCRYGSPHCRTGCVRDTFEICLGFVPSTVLHTRSIRTSVVPGVGHTVLSVRRCGRDAAIPPTKFVRP